MMVLRWSVGLYVLLAAALLARADDAWLLTTADFDSQRVSLRELGDGGAVVADDANNPATRQVGLDQLLMLERLDSTATAGAPVAQPSANNAPFVATLIGGDRATGRPVTIDGEKLIWENPTLGRLSLPMRNVISVVRSDQASPAASRAAGPATAPGAAQRTEDVITLLNRDSLHGIVTGIENNTVTIQPANGDQTPVPVDSVARIVFASTGAASGRAGHGFRIVLSDGSAITASRVHLTGTALTVNLPAAPEADRSIALSMIVSIEQVNGPVVWLSSIQPTQSIQRPLLDVPWPAVMDRSVDGTPLRFGDRTYSRGIGVHSYSSLTYTIDPAWKAFRTRYAIAGNLPYADVTVRIKLDDQVVHEQTDFRDGTLHPPVIVDLEGHQTLQLEVDYGQGYDVQDRLNWIEPALLTFKPAAQPPPATAASSSQP